VVILRLRSVHQPAALTGTPVGLRVLYATPTWAEDLGITCLIVLCKLSNGDIRSVITNREIERDVLFTIINKSGKDLSLSETKIKGIDIMMPEGADPLF
jgi:hypothetical protein